jgi:magnesium-transporting ATPase (P-type)
MEHGSSEPCFVLLQQKINPSYLMKKIREVFATMYQAILFSFSFCWRNSKSGTIVRIVTTIALAIFGYIKIRSTGYVLSALQNEYTLGAKIQSFYQSETFFALILIGVMLVAGIVLERVNWYYRSKWNQKLSFDNTREINAHKASLDLRVTRAKNTTILPSRSKSFQTVGGREWHSPRIC